MVTFIVLYTQSWSEIVKHSFVSLEEYCHKHKYAIYCKTYPDPYPPKFGFNKLKEIKDHFQSLKKTIVSLDADTLITNHNIRIEDFLDTEHDFYICRDYNGLNAGVFIIKYSKWSLGFLDELISMEQIDGIHCEQDAIVEYMKRHPEETKIKILPHPSINSYHYNLYPEIPEQTHEQGNWEEGDFLLHLPGLPLSQRLEILKNTTVVK